MAGQQSHAHLLFKLAYLQTQRRLGYEELLCGTRDIARLDNTREILKLAQVDGKVLGSLTSILWRTAGDAMT